MICFACKIFMSSGMPHPILLSPSIFLLFKLHACIRAEDTWQRPVYSHKVECTLSNSDSITRHMEAQTPLRIFFIENKPGRKWLLFSWPRRHRSVPVVAMQSVVEKSFFFHLTRCHSLQHYEAGYLSAFLTKKLNRCMTRQQLFRPCSRYYDPS